MLESNYTVKLHTKLIFGRSEPQWRGSWGTWALIRINL